MNDKSKQVLFEETAIPKAVAQLSVPAIIGCLVTILYNLADTYFVGYLNDPVQNAAVTLAAPILLAFNAVNNLFGVGSSSLMSRSLGLHDYDAVKRSAAFGIYCSLISGILFGVIYSVFSSGFLNMLGADDTTWQATKQYMLWTVSFGAAPAILNVVMGYLVRAEGAALHGAVGTMSGCLLNIVLDPIFIMPWGLNMGAAGAGCATFISNLVACG
jgi:Na+-driven multidrug efflux pump